MLQPTILSLKMKLFVVAFSTFFFSLAQFYYQEKCVQTQRTSMKKETNFTYKFQNQQQPKKNVAFKML